MGGCASKDRADSTRVRELLRDIDGLQDTIREQRARADQAVAALVARVEQLEKFTEELLKLANENKDASNKSGSAPDDKYIVELNMSPNVSYGLVFEADSKGHIVKALGAPAHDQGLTTGLYLLAVDDKIVSPDLTINDVVSMLHGAKKATFVPSPRRSLESELLQSWRQPIGKKSSPKARLSAEGTGDAEADKRTQRSDTAAKDSAAAVATAPKPTATATSIKPEETKQRTHSESRSEARRASVNTRKTIELVRDEGGYGIGVAGGRMPNDDVVHTVFIKHIKEGSVADRHGGLQVRDRIISINNIVVDGMDHNDIVSIMKRSESVILVIEPRSRKKGGPDGAADESIDDSGAVKRPPPIPEIITTEDVSVGVAETNLGNDNSAPASADLDTIALPSSANLRHPTLDRPKRPVRPPTRDRAQTIERLARAEDILSDKASDTVSMASTDTGRASSELPRTPEPDRVSAGDADKGLAASPDGSARRGTDRPAVTPRPKGGASQAPTLANGSANGSSTSVNSSNTNGSSTPAKPGHGPSAAWGDAPTTPAGASVGAGAVNINNGAANGTPAVAPSPALSVSRSLAEEAMRARLAKANKEAGSKEGAKETSKETSKETPAASRNGSSRVLQLDNGTNSFSRTESDELLTRNQIVQRPRVISFDEDDDRLNPFVFPPAPSPSSKRVDKTIETIDPFSEGAALPGAVYE